MAPCFGQAQNGHLSSQATRRLWELLLLLLSMLETSGESASQRDKLRHGMKDVGRRGRRSRVRL